jgi:hypothetical protein
MKEEIGEFSSIDPYKAGRVTEEEEQQHEQEDSKQNISAWISSVRESAYRTPEKKFIVLVLKKSVY